MSDAELQLRGHAWWRSLFEVLSPFEVILSRLAETIAYGRVGLVTADSPTDNHVAAAPEPQAVEDSAASSNEESGSSSARQLFLRHFPSTTSDTQGLEVTAAHGQTPSILQAIDAYRHPQVTTGYGQTPLCTTGISGRNRITLMAPSVLRESQRHRFTMMSPITLSQGRNRNGAWPSAIDIVLRDIIALQPPSDYMLTDLAGPYHLFFNTPCRDMMGSGTSGFTSASCLRRGSTSRRKGTMHVYITARLRSTE